MVNHYGKSQEVPSSFNDRVENALQEVVLTLTQHHSSATSKDYALQVELLQKIIGYFVDLPGLKASYSKRSHNRYDNLVRLIDSMQDSIRIDLCKCRERFPPKDRDKLRSLEHALDLLRAIHRFRKQVQTQPEPAEPASLIKDCFADHSKSVYQSALERCERRFAGDDETLDLWHALIAEILSHLDELSEVYARSFLDECNVVHVAAGALWSLFARDLRDALERHDRRARLRRDRHHHPRATLYAYLKLHFRVNKFYEIYVAETPAHRALVPEHYEHFEPFVRAWIEEDAELIGERVRDAFRKDASAGFEEKRNEEDRFSASVAEAMVHPRHRYHSLTNLNCARSKVKLNKLWMRYMQTLALNAEAHALAYASLVVDEFPGYLRDKRVACTLMNNVRQLKSEATSVFELMGGDALSPKTSDTFNGLQEQLNCRLEQLATMFANDLEPAIATLARKVKRLTKSDEGGAEDDDDAFLEAIKMLEDTLSGCALHCDELVLTQLTGRLRKTVVSRLFGVFVDATDEGVDKLAPEIEKLYDSARSRLRDAMGASSKIDFAELKSSMDLLKVVAPLRAIVQRVVLTSPSVSSIIEDCTILRLKSKYELMFNACHEMYDHRMAELSCERWHHVPTAEDYDETSPVAFLQKLVALVALSIEESREDELFERLAGEFEVERIVISTLWLLLGADLRGALEKKREKCNNKGGGYNEAAYVNLHLKVNWLYANYVESLLPAQDLAPVHCAWFQPFVEDWLGNIRREGDVGRRRFADALRMQRDDDLELAKRLCADAFANYREYLKVLLALSCRDDDGIMEKNARSFADSVHADLLRYREVLLDELGKRARDEKRVCAFMGLVNDFIEKSAEFSESIGISHRDELSDTTQKIESFRETLRLDLIEFVFERALEYLELDRSTTDLLAEFLLTATSKRNGESIELFIQIFDLNSLMVFVPYCDMLIFRDFFDRMWRHVADAHKRKVHLPAVPVDRQNSPKQTKADLAAWHGQQVLTQRLATIRSEDLHDLADMFYELLAPGRNETFVERINTDINR